MAGDVTRAAALRWEEAHGWGDHADAGYLSGETNPGALALDQSAPQEMSGFPKWRNPEQRVEGLAVQNGNGNNELWHPWTAGTWLKEGAMGFWFKTSATVTASYTKYILSIKPYGGGTGIEFFQNTSQGLTFYTGGATLSTPAPVNDGVWRLFTASWTTNGITLYQDGEPVATNNVATNGLQFAEGSSVVRLGYYGGTSRSFVGSLDEVAVWTNALAEAEARDLADFRIGLAETPSFPSTGRSTTQALVLLHRCEEASGNTSTNWVTGAGYAWKYAVQRGTGAARSGTGAAWTGYLEVLGDLAAGADRSRGVLRVGNAQATTRLSGGLAVEALHAAPATASAPGFPGEVRVAADALYVCVATNAWVRANLAAW